jgi:hypothetical protein
MEKPHAMASRYEKEGVMLIALARGSENLLMEKTQRNSYRMAARTGKDRGLALGIH